MHVFNLLVLSSIPTKIEKSNILRHVALIQVTKIGQVSC